MKTESCLSRRQFLGSIAGATLLTSCRPRALGLGYMANLTHAPMICLAAATELDKRIGSFDSRIFRVGPRVGEALLGAAIDIATMGPAALLSIDARHAEHPFVVLSSVCSGGASFVLANGYRERQLPSAVLAVPQIVSTQDVSLRKYLRARGLSARDRGGSVTVHALESATIYVQLQRRQLSGAWLPEPWATRAVMELSATRVLDERKIGPKRRFPTALLVARRQSFLRFRNQLDQISELLREQVRNAAELPNMKSKIATEMTRLTRQS